MQIWMSINFGLGANTPLFCSGVIFICYALAGNELHAKNVFPAMYALSSTRIILGYMVG